MRQPSGMLLLTGPAGSGKTTTIYGCLRCLAESGGRHIITIEDPVEQIVPGVMQTEVNEARGLDFAKAARHLLRQDPQAFIIGEIRDEETANIAVRAALTGHLVISTLHAGSCKGVLERLLVLCADHSAIAAAVELVLNQRLLRKVCRECGGSGCGACLQTGYQGRVPLVEWLRVDDVLRGQIRSHELQTVRRSARWRNPRARLAQTRHYQRGGIQEGFRLMKYDEFAFLNQQLAAMVRDGIPLESALRRLCADMRKGPLRAELEKMEADWPKARLCAKRSAHRQLPELYRQMLEVGAQSNDLPGVLTMLADHYQQRHVIWTRLKGLMVYPAIVLCGAFLLSCFLSIILSKVLSSAGSLSNIGIIPPNVLPVLWVPPVFLGLMVVSLGIALATPFARRALRWRLPAFREASLAQLASALSMMIKSGVPLDRALGLVEHFEKGSPVEPEVARWRERLATGRGKPSDMMASGRLFPPLFAWTVSQAGRTWPQVFSAPQKRTNRARRTRTELLLYSALPCSVLVLG